MAAIVVCTLGGKSLPVMQASIRAYSPETELVVFEVERSTFGQSYNHALREAFQHYDAVIVANDDVVLTPDTIPILLDDVAELRAIHGPALGLVAARSDDARMSQNIRQENGMEVKPREAVSPIFAWMSKHAFEAAKFPPINWYSDDVLCEDLNRLGFTHYLSRAYVHHVGSQTVGRDYAQLNNEALPWLRDNRPEYIVKWWGPKWL